MAVLLAGLPTTVTGVTVNRLCGSSLEAAIQAARAIRCGEASLVVAGGVESMSRAPWVLLKPSRAYPAAHETLHSTTLGWRMVNPRMPEQWTISLGASAERLAEIHNVSREVQDAFALRSHRLAAKAYREGVLTEVVPVPGVALTADEGIRTDTSLEALAELAPAFVDGGTVTAGNSSPLNDGASRSRRRIWRCRAPASAGARSRWSNSTRPSPRSRWPAWRAGPSSTLNSSTCVAAPSRSDIRSAPRARGYSDGSPTSCARAAAATVWRPSA
jgi:acetyl-CoA acetyltransferase